MLSPKLNKGLALLYLQKLTEAKAALEHSAEQEPNDPRTWYALGILYRSENQPQQGIKAFQRVLTLDSSNADSHYFPGSFQFDLHDFPAAIAEYRAALQINPLHASADLDSLAPCSVKAAQRRPALPSSDSSTSQVQSSLLLSRTTTVKRVAWLAQKTLPEARSKQGR